MYRIIVLFFVLALSGCSVSLDATVHDEDRAAELTKEYLTLIGTPEGTKKVYGDSHDKFKTMVNYQSFSKGMESMNKMIGNSVLQISAYETYGTDEAIVVYSNTINAVTKLYFRTTFLGTKSKGYKLLNFNSNDRGYEHKGIYKEYTNKIEFQKI